jgi:aspartate racemase
MGPDATVDLMLRVIKATPAKDDQDHIRMLVDNNPKVPSRIKALVDGSGESPAPTLIAMARGLAALGADFLAIPCNTAHYYLPEVQRAVDVPILNMIGLTCGRIARENPHIRCVGLLASTAVIRTALYKDCFLQYGVEVISPPEAFQGELLSIIREIKSGHFNPASLKLLVSISNEMIARKAEAIVIACTELSIAAKELPLSIALYDSAQVLAEVIVAQARAEEMDADQRLSE